MWLQTHWMGDMGQNVSSSEEAEVRTILAALSEAKMRGFPKVHLLSYY